MGRDGGLASDGSVGWVTTSSTSDAVVASEVGASVAHDAAERRKGTLAGIAAYSLWGVFPLVFHELQAVGAGEILLHRVVWSFVVVLGLLAFRHDRHWYQWLRDRPGSRGGVQRHREPGRSRSHWYRHCRSWRNAGSPGPPRTTTRTAVEQDLAGAHRLQFVEHEGEHAPQRVHGDAASVPLRRSAASCATDAPTSDATTASEVEDVVTQPTLPSDARPPSRAHRDGRPATRGQGLCSAALMFRRRGPADHDRYRPGVVGAVVVVSSVAAGSTKVTPVAADREARDGVRAVDRGHRAGHRTRGTDRERPPTAALDTSSVTSPLIEPVERSRVASVTAGAVTTVEVPRPLPAGCCGTPSSAALPIDEGEVISASHDVQAVLAPTAFVVVARAIRKSDERRAITPCSGTELVPVSGSSVQRVRPWLPAVWVAERARGRGRCPRGSASVVAPVTSVASGKNSGQSGARRIEVRIQ